MQNLHTNNINMITSNQPKKRLPSILVFIVIYLICQAVVFLSKPILRSLEKLAYAIDDFLNYTGIALADGEFDPAGLWVIFGVPFLCAIVLFYLLKKLTDKIKPSSSIK
ncbi:hypothetical protein A9G09_07200 [Gilliamella sp. wkB292]|nr:hypothetical protein A9G09_07200 [Gilliamella apicola]